jgi:hypothetical protein
MLEVLLLYLIIPGRINFLQLGRYGRFGEQRYRQQFRPKFDQLSFNASLAETQLGKRLAVTLTLLPYYMAIVTTKTNQTTNTWLIISKIFQNLFVVSKITKKSEI